MIKQAIRNMGNAALFAAVLTAAIFGAAAYRHTIGPWKERELLGAGAIVAAVIFVLALAVITAARRASASRSARRSPGRRAGSRPVRRASADGYTTR